MEALAARIAAFCLQKHYIEPDQIAWLQYGLMRRLMGMVTFLLLLPVGAFFDGWRSTFLFLLVFRFIRMRTGAALHRHNGQSFRPRTTLSEH